MQPDLSSGDNLVVGGKHKLSLNIWAGEREAGFLEAIADIKTIFADIKTFHLVRKGHWCGNNKKPKASWSHREEDTFPSQPFPYLFVKRDVALAEELCSDEVIS